jgi:hypothetical protein
MGAQYLICSRINHPGRIHVLSFKDHCKLCGHQVWRAYSSPDYLDAMCIECAVAKGTDNLELEAQTPEQRRDIDDYYRRHEN